MCAWHVSGIRLQARSQMMDEVSSAVDDAMTDATPLGRDQGLLESTAQSFVDGEESSLRQSASGENLSRHPNSMQVGSRAPAGLHMQAYDSIARRICEGLLVKGITAGGGLLHAPNLRYRNECQHSQSTTVGFVWGPPRFPGGIIEGCAGCAVEKWQDTEQWAAARRGLRQLWAQRTGPYCDD